MSCMSTTWVCTVRTVPTRRCFGSSRPNSAVVSFYPVYTIKQSSSKHRANIEQLEHTSCTCILNAFAGCLLDDCSMFAWWLLDRINGVFHFASDVPRKIYNQLSSATILSIVYESVIFTILFRYFIFVQRCRNKNVFFFSFCRWWCA